MEKDREEPEVARRAASGLRGMKRRKSRHHRALVSGQEEEKGKEGAAVSCVQESESPRAMVSGHKEEKGKEVVFLKLL